MDKQERYADFELLSLPYPGCEFFQQYCQHGYQDCGLVFDWNQSYIDAEVVLPPPLQHRPALPWHQYRVSLEPRHGVTGFLLIPLILGENWNSLGPVKSARPKLGRE